ncbi:hypothetical protein P170DRAFT_382755 [Aspergillus steynii IBT 23096]|uniref:Rhodopsin domain-containing protein n=1 Tax=Aspergillus steynii IBT 23096 TaxID=1392250 RepID=A0A2I2GEN4_9EURO|nr:uncharacterized protein P170DRAFT_382755 [Aspergillus steynii IBT 23096]PLB51343.1 hypothetical protein P170DRAFT_382755 [Aspergillus steynii IBT 23096]
MESSTPKEVGLNGDQRSVLRALVIVMLVIPTVAVLLRFWSRAMLPGFSSTPVRFWWDDWTALIAAMLNVAMCGIGLKLADLGVGLHMTDVSATDFVTIMKLLWAIFFIFDTGTSVARASALLFYTRVFDQIQSRFRYALWIIHGLNIAWMIGMHVVVALQCTPIERLWYPMLPGKCIPVRTLLIGSGIPSLIINAMILILPLPLLWRLKMKMSRKLLIIGVFLCGYLVVVVSIGRLVTVVDVGPNLEKDFTWEFMQPTFWLSSEIAISVVSVCLPSIFVFGRLIAHEGFGSVVVKNLSPRSKSRLGDSDIGRSYFSRMGRGDEEAELDMKLFESSPQKPPFAATAAQSKVTAYRESPQLPLPGQDFLKLPELGIMVRSEITVS